MFYQTIDFPVLKRCYLQKHMANQVDLLEEQLRRVEGRSLMIVDAATNRAEEGAPAETWWAHIVQLYGDEDTLFRRTLIDRAVFLDGLALVRDVPWAGRGRQSIIRTNREKLFFLMVFLSCGVRVLEVLVARFLRTRGHIIVLVKTIAARFLPLLRAGTIRYFDEAVLDVPDCSLIVDCTVCQIRRPAVNFNDAKVFYSGKHGMYCLKKEICVNARSVTAAIISQAFPGSVHDINDI